MPEDWQYAGLATPFRETRTKLRRSIGASLAGGSGLQRGVAAKRMLEKLGYAVLTAATPSEAIRLATEHTGKIQLLLTDVIMPEMNGRELATSLLSLHSGLRRLFMSGYTADVIADQGVLEEGTSFLRKPFTRETLAAKVRDVLDRERAS